MAKEITAEQKERRNAAQQRYRAKNPRRAAEYAAAKRAEDPELSRAKAAAWRKNRTQEQIDRKAASLKAWRERQKEHIRAYKATTGKEWNAEYRDRKRLELNAKNREYYKNNRDAVLARAKAIRDSKPEFIKAYSAMRYQKNKEAHGRMTKAYRVANAEKVKAMGAAWKKKYPEKVRAQTMQRIAAKYRAIPKWADLSAIEDVYKEAIYMQMDVDHIVPLQSKLVCGLHVWDNLQLLPKLENIRKGNRHWADMP